MKQKLERLKELESKATNGPWKILDVSKDEKQIVFMQDNSLLNFYEHECALARVGSWDGIPLPHIITFNANLICELRNALPDLLSHIDKQEKIIEVARAVIEQAERYHQGLHSSIGNNLREVLTTIEEIEKGE